MARRRDLFKSDAEIRADTLRRVTSKGRANFSEAAIILGVSHPVIRGYCNSGKITTFQWGKLRYISLEELERAKALV